MNRKIKLLVGGSSFALVNGITLPILENNFNIFNYLDLSTIVAGGGKRFYPQLT
ncbi:hypothetical protein OVS_01820 [Mycoplasma ovis str. Michigan]|uniref:Uncharacterized protein n=1 Tax=Mycoplasma ovis str. Michigan TaxID=1415773 RepID=A0ABM5P1K8_9MOLU|nr:hypothetical protein [Mycoplasma ovis]AHC40249.1 hypothetical protein OVS_01820 [Mycoplasma ovis str. Michigan]